jgi:hypothetical protein
MVLFYIIGTIVDILIFWYVFREFREYLEKQKNKRKMVNKV